MDAEFAIPPPEAAAEAPEGEQRLSNKEKRKLKQLQKQQEQLAEEQKKAAEAAAPVPIEETPLSHKEKRQAKKRRLALVAAGEDPDAAPAPSKSKAGGSASAAPTMIGGTAIGNTPARSSHGVWVGNLNFATHARDLLAWLQARGLAEITRINMPNGKRSHENNRGFAYLDFPTQTDVVVAVGLSEQNLDGRKLLIKASTDYTGRPLAPALAALPPLDPSALEPSDPSASASVVTGTGTSAPPQTLNRTARKILNRQKNPAGPTLFLGNLGFETVVDDIRDMFDRNQKRSREWEKKTKGDKKPKKSKGKKKREEGQDEDEDESSAEEAEEEEEEGSDDSSSEEESDGEEQEDEEEAQAGEDDDDADLTQKKPRQDKLKKKKEKGPIDLAKAETAGIRKVRLGTFEDTGKCKGWAFVDFHLPAQATRALLNLHNHSLNGRTLNVEYASAEAVRRGGLGTRAVSKANGAARARGGDDEGERPGRGGEKRKGRDWDDSDMAGAAAAAAAGSFYDGPPAARRAPRGDGFGERPRREERPGKGGERAKPGAALAMAQRASEAIVQSTGRKTTFE
ncbi:hypothetical protein JCM11491_005839 [Sporobolomyces phaffii]